MNKNNNGELYPRKLSAEEIKDPHLVIHQFFYFAGLPHCREYLWEWFKATVSGTFNTELLEKEQRVAIICFYKHIEKLIEAAHLIRLREAVNRETGRVDNPYSSFIILNSELIIINSKL